MYFAGIKIHNVDITINQGKERLFDLAAIKLRNAAQTLRKDLITDFYKATADGSDEMVGVRAFTANDKTVGGIDQSTNAFWQAGHISTAGSNRDLTWGLLNAAYYATKKYGAGDRPTLVVASEGVLEQYEDTLTKVTAAGGAISNLPLVQLMSASEKQGRKIEGGFDSFSFKGIPMVADPFAPANSALILNEKYLHWRVLQDFEATGWTQQRVNGKDWVQNTIFGYGALTSSSNRKLGIIEDLVEYS